MIIHFYQQFFCGPQSVGHEVTVLGGDFNAHDERDEPPEEYRSPSGEGGYRVLRFSSPRRMRLNLRRRLATYVTFAIKAGLAGMRLSRPDVIIGSIQPLFTGLAAMTVARRRGVPFLLEVVDLWPDALEVKGAVTGWRARALHRLANRLYRHAVRVVSLTPGMKVELLKKGIPADKIDVFPNGFDPEMYQLPAGARERVRAQFGWNNHFVAVYTGTHVEVTAVETIVRTAHVLRNQPGIRFDLFGSGQRKPAAMQLARDLGLSNIHFHDPVPKSRIPEILAGSDAALMTLFKSPLINIYFETKLVDYMSAGKGILAAMDGMQGEFIRRYHAGRVVESFDHEGLARLVEAAARAPAELAALGANGKRLVSERLLLKDILDRYVAVIGAVAEGRSSEIPAWEPF
jgi:glycosyltransferase involved in cell wall biosynthesis